MAIFIYKTVGGGFCCLAALHKVRCLVERQVHIDAVHEQHPVPVFHDGFLCIVHQLVDEAVLLGLLGCPPFRFIHPPGHFVLFSAGLFGVQARDALPDGVQRLNVLFQLLGVVVAVCAHANRMHHVGAVVGCDHLSAVTGHNGCRAGTQPVDLGRHLRRVLLQLISDCLGGKHISTAAVDTHHDLVQCPQSCQLLRELPRRHFIAPPARLRDVSVKQQLHGVSHLVAELPEFLVFRHCLYPPIRPPPAQTVHPGFRLYPPRAFAWLPSPAA